MSVVACVMVGEQLDWCLRLREAPAGATGGSQRVLEPLREVADGTGVAVAVISGVDARIDAPSSTKTGAVGPQHVVSRPVPDAIATMLGFWLRVHRSTSHSRRYKLVSIAITQYTFKYEFENMSSCRFRNSAGTVLMMRPHGFVQLSGQIS